MKCCLLFIGSLLLAFSLSGQHNGKPIKTNAESSFIPEGIAVDDHTGIIYLSSINHHKIIRVDKKGRHTDFVSQGEYSFLEGLGLKIDQQRKWLWALSNKKENNWYTSQLHAFNLRNGKQEQVYIILDTVPHLFNDLVVIGDQIYITDTYFSAIYHVDINEQKLSVFHKHADLVYPNGICFDPLNDRLYLATYKNGLVRVDRKTKITSILPGYSDTAMVRGLDGLILYEKSLIGVYNLGERSQHAVVHYLLTPEGLAVANEKIIDQGNSYFHEPTTLAFRKRNIYVIANSHLGVYNENKESTKGVENRLSAPVIIKYALKD